MCINSLSHSQFTSYSARTHRVHTGIINKADHICIHICLAINKQQTKPKRTVMHIFISY